MKRKQVIELFLYALMLIIGIFLLFTYEPKESEIVIPLDFEIELEGGEV